jgi:hypothetical protein
LKLELFKKKKKKKKKGKKGKKERKGKKKGKPKDYTKVIKYDINKNFKPLAATKK